MTERPSPAEIRDYLLRRLPDERRGQIEEAYFKNDALLDEVEAEEDQLVTEYVLGKLSESDRRRFEDSLLGAPYYKERVETTTRLQQQISRHPAFLRRERMPTSQTGLSDPRLFPGRTGFVVGFALLTILLIAATISAWMLKREVEDLKRQLKKETTGATGSSRPGPASPEKR